MKGLLGLFEEGGFGRDESGIGEAGNQWLSGAMSCQTQGLIGPLSHKVTSFVRLEVLRKCHVFWDLAKKIKGLAKAP